jgi:hypothetical protein
MSSILTPQLQAALLRALLIALPAGALATLTARSQGGDWQTALIVGGIAFLTPLIVRGVGEGLYDRHRAQSGQVRPSDVGYRR